jgi:hypothetical protein
MKNTKHGFSSIAVLIIVTVLAIGGYYLYTNKVSTQSNRSAPVLNSTENQEKNTQTSLIDEDTFRIISPADNETIKKGEIYTFRWANNNQDGTVYLSLIWYAGAHLEEVEFIGQISMKSGSYKWSVPKNLKADSGIIVIKDRADLASDVISQVYVKFE